MNDCLAKAEMSFDCEYRYFDRGWRWIAGLKVRCGTIVEKWDPRHGWTYLSTIPPDMRLTHAETQDTSARPGPR